MDDELKKRLCAAALAAGLVGSGLAACSSSEEVATVYGPPPDHQGDSDEEIQDVYGPPADEANGEGDETEIQLLYGPESEATEDDSSSSDDSEDAASSRSSRSE